MSAQKFEPIAVTSESTVVAEYEATDRKSSAYQSEAQLEAAFISLLKDQAYEFLTVTSETDLVSNLRKQLEALNKIEFTDTEWERFFRQSVSGETDGILEKTKRIQEDHIQVLKRDDGEFKNIYLLDKQHVHNNKLQVLNQYEAEGKHLNRYDVTILVNGLPLVHVELKRRGVDIREAFNQINRYQRDSFWVGSGLFQYVQLFVISNGTYTKYYSNTVRDQHVKDSQNAGSSKKTSNSFEFTSWWADANNKNIYDLMAFGKTFFAKHSLLNVLTRYCVLTSDLTLLALRPYQIVATERILQRIATSEHQKTLGTTAAGGYVWHTTGSGKTLTSFKTAQLASKLPGVQKVLFVVDRKDLDYQTMKEYERFEKGAANSNTSTAVLAKQLEDPNTRIIITTIQKLSKYVTKSPKGEIQKKRVVLIFDECHRSQFGDMHMAIRKAFSNYNLFGFTGTPIFAANAGSGGNIQLRTTEQAFGEKLHSYTIVNAISDQNVLPFRVDYVNTVKLRGALPDKQVSAIDTEKALLSPERIDTVVEYVLDHFDQKTRRNETYKLNDRRLAGFNSLFATASIEAAKRYYVAFQKAQADSQLDKKLKVGIIYSYAPNEEDPDGLLAEEGFETESLDKSSRDFLESAIGDFNKMFGTNWDTSADNFQGYYKDLAMRLKNREIDIVIVVNMFLTGFDATTLNTLWVDKNLRQHGLLQAFSRTNRILNRVKTYGNIVCFRDLEKATQDSISLFGNKEAGGIVLLAPYSEYYEQYKRVVEELLATFTPGELPIGEADKKQFIVLYNNILRLRNILSSFDDFTGNEILSHADFQDFQSTYLEVYRARPTQEKESILDDLVFEIELIKQVEINVDYILTLVRQLQESGVATDENREIKANLERAVDSSFSLRSKKDLIEKFVESLNVHSDVDESWKAFIDEQKTLELEQLIENENLDVPATHLFVSQAFRDGQVQVAGPALSRMMPPKSMFTADNDHGTQKLRVATLLQAFFERYFGL
ncbi:MAG: type I restriction endonuclease subunit R [Aquiluna sp.]|nr:type I restriction endonuclease subunit R [Aquiluna sp.]